MKRRMLRPLAGVLGISILATGAALALGAGDSLITLSYLEERYIPQVVEQGDAIYEEKLTQVYDEALKKLERADGETSSEQGMLYSKDFASCAYVRGDRLALETGSGFLMLSGQAMASHNGAFVDVTSGELVPASAALIPGHRYLVGEDSMALIEIQSGLAWAGVQGGYLWEASGEEAAPFIDVSLNDWHYKAVDYAYFNGLFAGMGEDQFQPESNMDRSMMMTVLYHLAGSPESERLAATAAFSDVPQDKWYYTFVNWAAEKGVSAGTGDGKFSPTQPVTREQVIVLLYNFATNYMGMTLSERTDISGYPDHADVAFWSEDAVSWAVASGVATAPSGTLEPGRGATRAEVASMLMNFSQRYLE